MSNAAIQVEFDVDPGSDPATAPEPASVHVEPAPSHADQALHAHHEEAQDAWPSPYLPLHSPAPQVPPATHADMPAQPEIPWQMVRDYLFFKRPSPEAIREWARKVAERQSVQHLDNDSSEIWIHPSGCRHGICKNEKIPVFLRPEGRGSRMGKLLRGQVYRVIARSSSGDWLQIYLEPKKLKGWIPASSYTRITRGEFKLLRSADPELTRQFANALSSSMGDFN